MAEASFILGTNFNFYVFVLLTKGASDGYVV